MTEIKTKIDEKTKELDALYEKYGELEDEVYTLGGEIWNLNHERQQEEAASRPDWREVRALEELTEEKEEAKGEKEEKMAEVLSEIEALKLEIKILNEDLLEEAA